MVLPGWPQNMEWFGKRMNACPDMDWHFWAVWYVIGRAGQMWARLCYLASMVFYRLGEMSSLISLPGMNQGGDVPFDWSTPLCSTTAGLRMYFCLEFWDGLLLVMLVCILMLFWLIWGMHFELSLRSLVFALVFVCRYEKEKKSDEKWVGFGKVVGAMSVDLVSIMVHLTGLD
ncbi:hypothetical protein Nepgr_026029 [Nepenthes gracilis]|uniref:Uncharacterized protein n=1 Tax=Nepenthes gracilis TaxID=150966 RepID=A0AAD3T924_NEPGR|nr:hypothetical protein Nepgr_026029 [Nepenthes gracilis]